MKTFLVLAVLASSVSLALPAGAVSCPSSHTPCGNVCCPK